MLWQLWRELYWFSFFLLQHFVQLAAIKRCDYKKATKSMLPYDFGVLQQSITVRKFKYLGPAFIFITGREFLRRRKSIGLPPEVVCITSKQRPPRSSCELWLLVSDPYDIQRWNFSHVEDATIRTLSWTFLTEFFWILRKNPIPDIG